MPYGRKRYPRRTYRKRKPKTTTAVATRRRTYRRATYKKSRVLRPKWLNPMGQKLSLIFTYCDTNFSRTLNAAGSYTAYYVFRGNSPYDPDYTGVGSQPYGFDQLCTAQMYANYSTPASSIRVYFRVEPLYATVRRLHAAIIPLRSAAPVLTDPADVRMIPNSRHTTYDGLVEGTKGAKMINYMSSRKLIQASSTSTSYEGSYAGNPGTIWYWLVYFYADDYDDEEVDIYFDVKIKYYTLLARGDVPNES